jgi:hypothetical protein
MRILRFCCTDLSHYEPRFQKVVTLNALQRQATDSLRLWIQRRDIKGIDVEFDDWPDNESLRRLESLEREQASVWIFPVG